jgi:hypothetical protein
MAAGLAVSAEAPAPQGGMHGFHGALNADKADNLLGRSNFVFIGTVMQTGASNLSAVKGSAKTCLVRVEMVVNGTPMMQSARGQVVTVRTDAAGVHRVGQRGTFFLNVDTFGEHLSGSEVGAFPCKPGDETAHFQAVAGALRAEDDRDLKGLMSKADRVVAGRIVSVQPAGIKEDLSEHAADWQRADIEVDTVIKGQPGTKTVSFFFPASNDRIWRETPRFSVGDQGVWILHAKANDHTRKDEMLPGLTAIHPKDFQRADQRERIQRLAAAN